MTTAPIAERETDSLRRSVRSLTGELLTVYEELALIYSLGARVARLTDEHEITAAALREAMDVLAADSGWVVLFDGESWAIPVECRLGIAEATAGRISRTVIEPLHQQGGEQVLSHSLKDDFGLPAGGMPARFLASSLHAGGGSCGYLCLARGAGGRIFTSADQKLITAVASVIALALENARLYRSEFEKQRLQNELQLAHEIQQALLPTDFSCADFLQASGLSEPCYDIGGDYFDLFRINNAECLMVIADVSGKGASAALQASMVQGIIYGVARHCQDLSRLMETLNRCFLARVVQGKFVTAFVATLDGAGHLRYSNGGHNPALWIHANGEVTELEDGGPLLGVIDNASYPERSLQLTKGDLILFYTDGVTDAADKDGETFGLPRLLDWAGQQAGRPAAEVGASLTDAVKSFCGGARQADDLTMLAVQYTGRDQA